MNEKGWTAGDWEVNTLAGRPIREVFSGDILICDCGIGAMSVDMSDTKIEANAHLIAAAPELYAACELALNAFEKNWTINWDDLRRALAKARGEAPAKSEVSA